MGFPICWAFFLAVVGIGNAANVNVYIENAQYRGHYLAGNSTAGGSAFLRNPPLSNEHRWMVDWDLIFLPKGGIITWPSNGNILYNAVIDTNVPPVINVNATSHNWKMTYNVIDGITYYRFLTLAAAEIPLGCLWNNGTIPVVMGINRCSDNNMRSLWKVYST